MFDSVTFIGILLLVVIISQIFYCKTARPKAVSSVAASFLSWTLVAGECSLFLSNVFKFLNLYSASVFCFHWRSLTVTLDNKVVLLICFGIGFLLRKAIKLCCSVIWFIKEIKHKKYSKKGDWSFLGCLYELYPK